MSDRVNYITVILEEDKREDDCEATLNAIRNIKGVLSVEPNISNPDHWLAEVRARHELGGAIMKVIFPKLNEEKTSK